MKALVYLGENREILRAPGGVAPWFSVWDSEGRGCRSESLVYPWWTRRTAAVLPVGPLTTVRVEGAKQAISLVFEHPDGEGRRYVIGRSWSDRLALTSADGERCVAVFHGSKKLEVPDGLDDLDVLAVYFVLGSGLIRHAWRWGFLVHQVIPY